ncbi:MAG: general secretion pathway protein GspK [Gemmatimonadetes bacterium]|nr:general secretion pathway protein GspK [Gemmatimonadota bacterium]
MNRRGFALLASIWLMVAIAAVAFEVSYLARSSRLAVANTLEQEQGRGAANAALEHARARLARLLVEHGDAAGSSLADPWRFAEGKSDTVQMGEMRYAFSLEDDGATLDVNRVTEADLHRLFAACGADDALASRMAQRVADWRDEDDSRRAQGAERTDYLAAGARELPRDGAIERVDELRDVLGMPDTLWRRARTFLNVGGIGQVNVNAAPREVLRSLPGMSDAAVEALLAARRSGERVANFQELSDRLPPGDRAALLDASAQLLPRLSFDAFAMRVRGEGWVEGSPVHVRAEALMVRGGGAVFVQWRRIR